MTKHKRLINKWLADFIEVFCDLSDANFKFAVESGRSTLNVPTDMFDTFRRRGVIEHAIAGEFYFLTFTNDSGAVMVTVCPDDKLKNGLVLTIPQ